MDNDYLKIEKGVIGQRKMKDLGINYGLKNQISKIQK